MVTTKSVNKVEDLVGTYKGQVLSFEDSELERNTLRAGKIAYFYLKSKIYYRSAYDALEVVSLFIKKQQEYLSSKNLLINIAFYTIGSATSDYAKRESIKNALSQTMLLPNYDEAYAICKMREGEEIPYFLTRSHDDEHFFLIGKVNGEVKTRMMPILGICNENEGFEIILILCNSSLNLKGDINLN